MIPSAIVRVAGSPRRELVALGAGAPLVVAALLTGPALTIDASQIGREQAVLLAISRARDEAGAGRLDAAARAAGLTDRFHAADLAVLATAAITPARPALFGFVPQLDDAPPGPWLLELFGDDLAWVAGLEIPVVDGPPARKLHALWRELLSGPPSITKDDPRIAALGPAAVAATAGLLAALGR